MKKALITGVTGFAGSFLAEHLISKGIEVSGIFVNEKKTRNIRAVGDEIRLVKLNLLDEEEVIKTIGRLKPDYIFHLAALTSPMDSFDSPAETLQNNIKAQLSILEAVRKLDLIETKILIVSSAEIYGKVDKEGLPIDEDTRFMPTSPYAVSKITQDFLGLQYFLSYGLRIIRVRPFNHIGPRQSDRFAIAAFAKKIAEIEKGKREAILPVGNLSSKRDFTDVRDMVKAYLLALEKGKDGQVYNLGRGISYTMSVLLDKLLSLSTKKIEIKEDASLLRPTDNPELVCNRNKFSSITNWEPTISIETSLKDTLDYWRNII